jgi:pseudouridine kinase
MKNIIVVGTTFLDIKGFAENAYIPDGRNVGHLEYVHGGVARNVAEDVANLGHRVTFVSAVDNSALGQDILLHLRRIGVNTSCVCTAERGMGTWLAVFDDKGDVAGSVSQRSDVSVLLPTLDSRGDEIFSKADAVIMEMDIDGAVVARVIDLADRYGVPLYGLISNIDIALQRPEQLQDTACFICNQQEAGVLFGCDTHAYTPTIMRDLMRSRLPELGLNALVVTMGADGAVYVDRAGNTAYSPAHAVSVVDTTGAGDAFCAGFCSALVDGASLADALAMGNRASASVITSTSNVCSLLTVG